MKRLAAIIIGLTIIGTAGTAMAAADTANLTVNATVVEKFKITGTTALDFTLDPDTAGDVTSNTGRVDFWGTKGASAASISFGDGLNSSGPGSRRLKSVIGADLIPYSLDAIAATYAGNGKSNPYNVTISGAVANSAFIDAPAGNYSDTVIITVSW